ncbi:MAG: COR domain-containing protein [Planctomycetota bacterium]
MREAHLIDELSEAIGRPMRRAPAGFFEVLTEASRTVSLVGVDELIEALGTNENDPLYAVDESGYVSALSIAEDIEPALPAIAALQRLRFCRVETAFVTPAGARALAGLKHLEYLWVGFGSEAQRSIELLADSESLRGLILFAEESADVNPLSRLPTLETLVLTQEDQSLPRLSNFPRLRHLGLPNEAALEQGLDLANLESLYLEKPRGDLASLTRLRSLKRLHVQKGWVPASVLAQMGGLRSLWTELDDSFHAAIASLVELEELSSRRSELSDLSALRALTRLKRLDLTGCPVRDVSALQDHPALELLTLTGTAASSPPRELRLPRLRHLNWAGPTEGVIEDAWFLCGCPKLESLDLATNLISDLRFVEQLPELRSLNLSQNRIQDIEPLSRLSRLETLFLEQNRVTDLAPLAECAALSRLHVGENPIETASPISRLRRLEHLEIAQAGLTDLSFVKRLRLLFSLDARANRLSSLEPALELTNLAILKVDDNAITEVPAELLERRALFSLALHGNPLSGITRELYEGDGYETLRSLRDYFRSLTRGRIKHDRVKLVLVGNGRVGKTSVVSRLLDDRFDPDQPSTHGIQRRTWELPDVAADKLDGQPLQVDVWDFGGQDIYHATHRLFLKTRALFLLIWDRETEDARYSLDELGQRYENFQLPYWIDYIKALSGSPVLVVQNKVDGLADKASGYGVELKGVYPPPNGILDFLHVSAKREGQNGMPGLRSSIELAIEDIEAIGYDLPAQWVEVRDRLLAMNHRYVDYERYRKICADVGMGEGEDVSLALFLHQSGAAFYQPKEFGQRIILDQKWAIEAVYALLDRRGAAYSDLKNAARHGLRIETIREKVWRHFPPDEHELLLEFMKSCELCFEFSPGVFLVPQLLPEETPSRVRVRWPEPTPNGLRVDYPFLHRAIIERFLVRAGLLGADVEPEIWRNGIVIYDPGSQTEALVEAQPDERRITVHARGREPVDLLNHIRGELDDLHRDFPTTVSVTVDGARYVELDALRAAGDTGADRVACCEGELVEVASFRPYLTHEPGRLPRGRMKPAAPLGGPAPAGEEIFLSYAWGDPRERGESREAIVDRLHDALIERGHTVVRDKQDAGYREEISRFMRRVGRGRIVVMVVSDKYLKSPYCMFELLEIHERGGFRERVFPITLGDATLYDLEHRLSYVEYWAEKKRRIEEKINRIGLSAFSSDGAFKEYDLYYRRVFNHVDQLTSLLADWNTLTPELLEENRFQRVIEAIEAQLRGSADPA